jgi:hypothetical protein
MDPAKYFFAASDLYANPAGHSYDPPKFALFNYPLLQSSFKKRSFPSPNDGK